jgi:hypothetical protein
MPTLRAEFAGRGAVLPPVRVAAGGGGFGGAEGGLSVAAARGLAVVVLDIVVLDFLQLAASSF